MNVKPKKHENIILICNALFKKKIIYIYGYSLWSTRHTFMPDKPDKAGSLKCTCLIIEKLMLNWAFSSASWLLGIHVVV